MKKLFLTLLITSNLSLYSAQQKVEYTRISIIKKHPKKVAAGILLTTSGALITYSPDCKKAYFKNSDIELTDIALGLSAIGIALLSYTICQHLYDNKDQELTTTTTIDASLVSQPVIQDPTQEEKLENTNQQKTQKIYLKNHSSHQQYCRLINQAYGRN